MFFKWLLSSKLRHATAMRKHVLKILHHQRDLLKPQALDGIKSALTEFKPATVAELDGDGMEKQMEGLEKAANKWLMPYPNASWRENVEVLLVALTVAMGIRTFFLQPFKIPTGSMQPTLFGVTSENLLGRPDFKIPSGWERVKQWFEGISYLELVSDADGTLQQIDPPVRLLIFNIKQTLYIGGVAHTIWFPPDYGSQDLGMRAGIHPGDTFKRGEEVVRVRVQAGDHLFVDRLTYNFRPPNRGEIIVFETRGIPEEERMKFGIPGDQFYIKRLVALSGEKVQLNEDRHVRIDGKRLDASTPHFENVYGFDPTGQPQESHYSGHVDRQYLAPFFHSKPGAVVTIPKDEYMVMGDNTMNSLDSRAWGYFPASSVIGRGFFVYWPFSDRFGACFQR
jgi:signal peptidase I